MALENATPTLYEKSTEREITEEEEDEDIVDEIDSREIFDILWNCIHSFPFPTRLD